MMLDGGSSSGVGTGENLNEHILGDHWPPTDIRLEMLEAAVEVMRALWQGGSVTQRGRHYRVENAQVYSLPPSPPPVFVSAFGPKATDLAAASATATAAPLLRRRWSSATGTRVATPTHFEQVSTMVTEDQIAQNIVCGPACREASSGRRLALS